MLSLANPTSIVISAALLLGVWGFAKRWKLTDNQSMGVTFGIGLLIALLPNIYAAFPAAQPWLSTIIDYVSIFVGVFGNQTTLTLGSQKVAQHFGFFNLPRLKEDVGGPVPLNVKGPQPK